MNADSNGLQPGYLDITLALDHAFTAGARVHNDSWGPAEGTFPDLEAVLNTYSQQGSAQIDAFVVTNPTMLVVTAAGNSGNNGSTIATLSCSKNSLVVGNSGNGQPPSGNPEAVGLDPNAIDHDSSRGPSPGGRLKPDVVAPGEMVAMRCPQTGCHGTDPYIGQPNYGYANGTSVSTPLVSGTALLVRELITHQVNRPDATGMLIKALLINGAEQLYQSVPDNSQGWGRINLRQSLNEADVTKVYFFDSLSERDFAFSFVETGQSVVFENVNFVQGSPLAITLTWYDPVDATGAGVLINDLDLTLTLGNGTVYHGGVDSMQNGQTLAAGPADTTNNTQKIILFQAPAGPCTIAVTATRIAANQRQPFALVVSPVISQGDLPQEMAQRQLQALPNES
jgi:hypothetical protein